MLLTYKEPSLLMHIEYIIIKHTIVTIYCSYSQMTHVECVTVLCRKGLIK